jgi:hypothetical protein
MKMVCRFCATATGIWKMQNAAIPIHSGIVRPYTSDKGP